jgi:serine/threonine protein kinase/pSer/pThr/pTyr-binding forkhead associated (FHA) protein
MSTLQEGQLFERYRIQRLLGISVSGESYEAEDTMLLRKVMLKLIHPWETLPDSGRRQFFREMQGISILNHPYLASVLDFGEFNSRLYVARRYANSSTLSGNEGRLWFTPLLDVSHAIHYIHQLAQALQHIHNHGYLHGSLTFSNILVLRGPNLNNDPDYAPFLLADSGLANFVRRFGYPQNQLLPIAAAPEQYSKRVTPASDQFALAVLLYFWLTGRPPFLGTPQEIEYQKLTESITPLSSFNPQVTFEQEGILLRALSVYPEDRYTSVLAFADTLLATLAPTSQAVPASEPTAQPVFTAPIESTTLEHEPQTEALTPMAEAIQDEAQGPDFVALTASTSTPEDDSELTTSTMYDQEQEPEVEAATESELLLQTQLAIMTQTEIEHAPGPLPQIESTPIPEMVAHLESSSSPQFGTVPETDPALFSEPEARMDALIQSEPAPTPQPQPQPAPAPAPAPAPQPAPQTIPTPEPEPAPTPKPEPDIPQPIPEPDVPQPTPDPIPTPQPDIPQTPSKPDVPQPAPDPIPQPAPDVPQPLPEPNVPQTPPQTLPQAEHANLENLSAYQELLPQIQPEQATTIPLLIITSPYTEQPSQIRLESDEITLGRAGSSDILLDQDNLTSRHHALLKHESNTYIIYDRRSANGVFVNGQKIETEIGYELADGDHISIGNYELIFRLSPIMSMALE